MQHSGLTLPAGEGAPLGRLSESGFTGRAFAFALQRLDAMPQFGDRIRDVYGLASIRIEHIRRMRDEFRYRRVSGLRGLRREFCKPQACRHIFTQHEGVKAQVQALGQAREAEQIRKAASIFPHGKRAATYTNFFGELIGSQLGLVARVYDRVRKQFGEMLASHTFAEVLALLTRRLLSHPCQVCLTLCKGLAFFVQHA